MDVQRALLEHGALRQLRPAHLAALTACGRFRRFDGGESLFRAGEIASSILFVITGRVVLASPEGAASTLLPGDVYGTSWLSGPDRWSSDAHVPDPTEVVLLDGPCVRRKVRTDSELGFELASRLLLHANARLEQLRRA